MAFDSFTTPGSDTPAARDVRLFTTWKKAVGFEKDQALAELLSNLSGSIGVAINSFRGSALPMQALELQARTFAVEALKEYDASRSAGLGTYITTSVKQKLYRYVGTYQNAARIPEHHIQKIGPYREAIADLNTKFGREPTTHEIADHLGVAVSHVTELQGLIRKDLLEFGGGLDDIAQFEHDPDFEKAMMAYYSLTPDEQNVFDYSLGAHGKLKATNNEIAKKLGISAGRVSQLRTSIGKKINSYLGR
jgi:RNA polymerase sigma factor (sigma-70 family)